MLGWKTNQEGGYRTGASTVLEEKEERILEAVTKHFLDRPGSGDAEEQLRLILKRFCLGKGILMERERGERIIALAKAEVQGFGLFDCLLADDELEEISVVGVNEPVRVFHRTKGWLETDCRITSADYAVDVVNKMARPLGRRLTYRSPRLNAVFPDGSRLHASISPLTLNGVEITIRKFRKKPFSAADFCGNATVSAEAMAFLWLCLASDVSLLIAGNTGSGKTSMLNALFSFVPLSERVVVIEESPEIRLPHRHCVRMVSGEGTTMQDLVEDTLRMRPDRVVVGEVRSREEVKALFDSLMAGQAKGAYSTFHGDSAEEAVARLKSFGVGEGDLRALDLVLVQKRFSSSKGVDVRRVFELGELDAGKPLPLFRLSGGRLSRTKGMCRASVLEKLCLTYSCSRKELLDELERRTAFLSVLERRALDFDSFTEAVQSWK